MGDRPAGGPPARSPAWVPAAAVAGLVASAVALCWPVSVHPARFLLGGLERPTANGEVFLAAVARDAFLHGRLRWFVTDLVNHPHGQDLGPRVAHSLQLALELVAIVPFGPLVGVNVAGVLFLALNGLAAWWVARRLLGREVGALIAGLFFQLNSFTLVKLSLGSLHKGFQAWLPFFLYGLLRLRERPTWRSLLLPLLALSCGYQCYPVYAFYALLLAGLALAWDLLVARRPRAALSCAALIGAFGACNFALDALIGAGEGAAAGAGATHRPVFVPSGTLDLLHPFRTFLGPPTDLPVGLSFVGLALAAVAVAWRSEARTRFLAVAAVAFALLAAGPFVQRGGVPVAVLGVPLLLPHKLLDVLVPNFYGSGVGLFFPIRALPIAFLCLALLAGAGVERLARALGVPAVAAGVLAIGAYGAEHAWRFAEILPVRSGPAAFPALLDAIREDPASRAILHLPATADTEACHRYCLYSAVAEKRSVNPYDREGLWLEVPDGRAGVEARQRFVDQLLAAGVHDILVHGGYAGPGFPRVDLGWLAAALGPHGVRREGSVTAYHLPEGLAVAPHPKGGAP